MPFWICYYHIVWATKQRQPRITPAYEKVIFAAIEEKSSEWGCKILAMNSVPDHLHVAVSIPPSLAVAKWVGSVKGATSRAINTRYEPDGRFQWQEGYGVMSFGETALERVTTYIVNQKERHMKGDLNSYLERIDED